MQSDGEGGRLGFVSVRTLGYRDTLKTTTTTTATKRQQREDVLVRISGKIKELN